jgi:hypothetical protein
LSESSRANRRMPPLTSQAGSFGTSRVVPRVNSRLFIIETGVFCFFYEMLRLGKEINRRS